MGAPELAVVIPTHNRREYLAAAIDSALVERDLNFEVVVVDDGSEDGTAEFLAEHPDPRVRWFRHSPARGGSAARNTGFESVTADKVMFLDDDDLLEPHTLQLLVSLVDRHADVDGAAGAFVTFGNPSGVSVRQPRPLVGVRRPIWPEHILGWNIPPGASLWRSRAVAEMGGWTESLRRCEDLDFNLRMYPRRVALTSLSVLRYRVHATQVDQTASHLQELAFTVRRAFVDTLEGRDRDLGEQLLRAREHFFAAMGAYETGDYDAAAAGFVRTFRAAPYLLRSPILNPWLLGMLAKAGMRRFRPARRAA